MRKLYNEFFHIPKDGKISEKVMLARMVSTVVIVVVCLAAMGITAYAYFSCNLSSGTVVLKAATFEADVLIQITDVNGESVPVTEGANGIPSAALKAGTTYLVTLDESARSSAKTGFCIITADDCQETYHTQQLGVDTSVAGDFTDQIVFHLRVSADTNVYFLSHWGTTSHYAAYAEKGEGDKLYITNGNINENAVVLNVNGATNSVSELETEPSETEPPTTEPPTTEVPEEVYTVESGDTLSEIAARYDTTVDLLAAYNNIDNPGEIQVGKELKIPPAGWQITDATEPGSAS